MPRLCADPMFRYDLHRPRQCGQTQKRVSGPANPGGIREQSIQEPIMSNSLKALCALALLAVVAACGNQNAAEDYVVVDPSPVTVEPVYTGKYGN